MPSYQLIVMSRPVEGKDRECNNWHQDIHLPELVALPGIVAARRLRAVATLSAKEPYPYATVYQIETEDIDGVLRTITDTAAAGQLTMSDSLDTSSVHAVAYEEFGDEVFEP